jgi:predicted tellurium resistance membrane protein TerC
MNKYAIVVYMAGSILAHTAIKMIFEDRLIEAYIPHMAAIVVPWIAAILVLTYGFYSVRNMPAEQPEE